MKRGDILLAALPPSVGRRAVLLVTRTRAVGVRAAVTVAPVTRTVRGIESEVPLGRPHGLRARSVANCDSLQTIPREALCARPIGRLPAHELPVLDRALRFPLGIRT